MKHTNETKRKIGVANKGKTGFIWKGKHFSQLHRQNLSNAHKGKKLSEEHKNNIGRASKKRWPLVAEKLRLSHFGKHLSDEHKKKISEANKANPKLHQVWLGKKHSEEELEKMRQANLGSKNPAWKGGITSLGKAERARFKATIHLMILERDNYTCQLCNTRGGFLQVDHIQSWADYVELRFSMDNCRTLCMNCHYLITFGKKMPPGMIWGQNKYYARTRKNII